MLTLDSQLVSLGYQKVTNLSSVQKLAPPPGAVYALIAVAGQTVRWRDDGTDPNASTGMPIPAGRELWYTGRLHAIRFIEETASAEVNVAFYKSQ